MGVSSAVGSGDTTKAGGPEVTALGLCLHDSPSDNPHIQIVQVIKSGWMRRLFKDVRNGNGSVDSR